MRFAGSDNYVATRDLTLAVNAAITLQRPLPIKGESGTGKNMLAEEYETPSVVLIDEIDKADIEFPNDLLRELDRMEFYVYETRQTIQASGLKKKPSTSELLDWLKLLLAEDIPSEALRVTDRKTAIPPLHGALLKNEQDVHLFERLIFMAHHKH